MSFAPRRPIVHSAIISASFIEPVRHGTHLPHDSLRKNRTELSAMSSMHARSSHTTIAPEPTVAPAAVIAFQSSGRSSIDAGRYPPAGPDGAYDFNVRPAATPP